MPIATKPLLLAAPALAAVLAIGLAARHLPGARPASPGPALMTSSVTLPRSTVEFCRRSASLLYDVTWAAVCEAHGEDSIECTLPDPMAARVNALLAAEERRCLAVEAIGGALSASRPSPPAAPTGRTALR